MSQVAAFGLVALDRLEQRFEVALPEPSRPASLDDLEEHGGPVRDGLGEDLQQHPFVVPVDEDVEFLERVPRKVDTADAPAGLLVVRAGHAHEPHTAVAQATYG